LRVVEYSLPLLATTSAFSLLNMSLMTTRGETVEWNGVLGVYSDVMLENVQERFTVLRAGS
jgi:hypothetical protein